MKYPFIKACFFLLAVILSSCMSSGVNLSAHVTTVGLDEPNYRIVAKNVSGSASIEGVLGVSYGYGLASSQMSLIPITSNRMLYKTAMENLWSGFEADNGKITGRKLALVNMRYDSESLNVLVYTKLSVSIIADVIEFEE